MFSGGALGASPAAAAARCGGAPAAQATLRHRGTTFPGAAAAPPMRNVARVRSCSAAVSSERLAAAASVGACPRRQHAGGAGAARPLSRCTATPSSNIVGKGNPGGRRRGEGGGGAGSGAGAGAARVPVTAASSVMASSLQNRRLTAIANPTTTPAAGADTRPLLSSTGAVSVTIKHPTHPKHPLTPPGHGLHNPYAHPLSHNDRSN